ncbi:MAG TPA: trigger factor, partial [Opitutaceae bacterium]|nr:trigger factor [Opitutaceae bacterium]
VPFVNVQLNSVSPTRKTLVVSLEVADVDAEYQAVVADFVRQARLPGFRPGKAPAAMVQKRYGKEIADEFKNKLVAKAYRSALEKEKLAVLNVVNVAEGEIAPGKPAEVTVTVDVRPEISVPDTGDLVVELDPTEPTEAEIDQMVEALRADRADFKTAERPAQKGDYVKLAYEGRLEGKPIADLVPGQQLYGKVPQTWEEVEGAQGGHLPGLGKHLAGVKAGDRKSVPISFPPDFAAAPALAGRNAEYDVEIQEVRERVLPALDAAFFQAHEVADLAALREQIRGNLRRQKEMANQSAQRRQVTDALAKKVEFPVPESLIDAETQGVLRQFIEENMRRGVPAEQFEKDKKELFAGARQAAERRVKLQLLLAKIAEEQKLEVTEADLDQQIYREATRSGKRPEAYARDLAKNRQQLRALQESIIFDKAVDFLVSKAKVQQKQPAAS